MAAKSTHRWSAHVMATSDALDLQPEVFRGSDPRAIAASLKRSAQRSRRRKAEPFRSAMSMLVFYINRAGKNLPRRRRAVLEAAKDELRIAFHRPARAPARRAKSAHQTTKPTRVRRSATRARARRR